MYLGCIYQRTQSLQTFSLPVITLLYMVLYKHILRNPLLQTTRRVTRDSCRKARNAQDSPWGCLLAGSWAPWPRTNQRLLQSQIVCYHSSIYTDWEKLQGIPCLNSSFYLIVSTSHMPFPNTSLPWWIVTRLPGSHCQPKTLISICVNSVSTLPWLCYYSCK